jgi:SM-20-related protein
MMGFHLDENAIAEGLTTAGYAIVENAFDAAYARDVREEISRLQAAGCFQPAGIGKAQGRGLHPEIRRDGTCWFDPGSLSPLQAALWVELESLRAGLNRELFLGLWDLEGHYAVYGEGAFYRKHLDRFRDDSKRTVSVVCFFNEGWRREDGGCLVMDLPDGRREILPEAGTAVFFLSDRIPHEVAETRRERASFAGWYRTR